MSTNAMRVRLYRQCVFKDMGMGRWGERGEKREDCHDSDPYYIAGDKRNRKKSERTIRVNGKIVRIHQQNREQRAGSRTDINTTSPT